MKKRPVRAFAFIQEWGCYPEETLVVVGTKDPKDFFLLFKKLKVKAGIAIQTLKWMKSHTWGKDDDNGSFLWVDGPAGRMTILYLKEWPKKASWSNYQTLMHELHHAVDYVLVQCRGMGEEREAQAYAQEQMFEQIRRKLDNLEPHHRINIVQYAASVVL